MKASGNFNSSADAEVLYKAMKGLGKMLVCVCVCCPQTVSSDTSKACESVVQHQQTNERAFGEELVSEQLL